MTFQKNLLALVALVFVSACASHLPEPNQRKEVIVTEVRTLHAVHFADGGYNLTPQEAESLLVFLGDIHPERGDIVRVEYPLGSVPGDVWSRRAETVAAFLRHYGVDNTYFTLPERAPNGVRVGLDRVAVNPPAECPDWRQDEFGDNFVNSVSPNHGCATSANLAAMIANPRDLLKKSDQGTYYGARVGQALTRYRNDQVKSARAGATSN